MRDFRPKAEQFEIEDPSRSFASDGKRLYNFREKDEFRTEALSFFSSTDEISFDALYPVYFKEPAEGRAQNSSDIDDFVTSLPVKQMYDVYVGVWNLYAFDEHDYLWMLQWLDTSMSLSKITREQIKTRLRFLNDYIDQERQELDAHVEHYIRMQADIFVDAEEIDEHRREGRQLEREHNLICFLMEAMNVVDIIAYELSKAEFQGLCKCEKCKNFPTQDYPTESVWHELPPKTFYCEDSGEICIGENYRRYD